MNCEKRHTCCICGRKKIESNMTKLDFRAVNGFAWACSRPNYWGAEPCRQHNDIDILKQIVKLNKKIKCIKSRNYII